MGLMGDKRNLKYNQSGYADPTAYEAISQVIKEETELGKKIHYLISVLIDAAIYEQMQVG